MYDKSEAGTVPPHYLFNTKQRERSRRNLQGDPHWTRPGSTKHQIAPKSYARRQRVDTETVVNTPLPAESAVNKAWSTGTSVNTAWSIGAAANKPWASGTAINTAVNQKGCQQAVVQRNGRKQCVAHQNDERNPSNATPVVGSDRESISTTATGSTTKSTSRRAHHHKRDVTQTGSRRLPVDLTTHYEGN